ncbi:MAG: VOC family protein [Bacteroidota bacterium]
MKLGYTILYVSDVAATLLFYERAFGLERGFVHPAGDYAELATGATTLALAADELAASNFEASYRRATSQGEPAAFELAFVTDEVVQAYERALAAGAHSLAAPVTKPWGQTVAYVRDLNGVIVELCTPVG